jgi:hypothetical protein
MKKGLPKTPPGENINEHMQSDGTRSFWIHAILNVQASITAWVKVQYVPAAGARVKSEMNQ